MSSIKTRRHTRLSVETLERRQLMAVDLLNDFSGGSKSSEPSDFLYDHSTSELGPGYYMAADLPDVGREVAYYRPDTGTINYFDIYPGVGNSSPAEITRLGNKNFVVATSPDNGRELWLVSGDSSGGNHSIVRDIRPGSNSSNPENLFVMGDWLFFTAEGNPGNRELWRTDGTWANTVLVKEVNPSVVIGSNPRDFAILGTELYFSAGSFANGRELWKTGGTADSTKMVKDIYSGASGSDPQGLTVAGSKLFFSANHPTYGRELWISDGTATGTKLLKNIATGSASSNPEELTAVNDNLYFRATTSDKGTELYRYEPNVIKDVFMPKDLMPGSASSMPAELTAANGFVYFVATVANEGRVLCRSGGIWANTVPLKQLNGSNVSSDNDELFYHDGYLYSRGFHSWVGHELWVTRISDNYTKLYDLDTYDSSQPSGFIASDEGVIFTAITSKYGTEVYGANGHDIAGLWFDANPGTQDSTLLDMETFGDSSYLAIQSANNGGEAKLWRHNPTTGVLSQYSGPGEQAVAVQSTSNAFFYFAFTDADRVNWKVFKATGNMPVLVQSLTGGTVPLSLTGTYTVGEFLYFVFSRTENGVTVPKLYRTSLASGSATQVTLPTDTDVVFSGVAVGNELYLATGTSAGQSKLVKVTGTSASLVPDVVVHKQQLSALGSQVIFTGKVGNGVEGLYASNGTAAGTQLLRAGLSMESHKSAVLQGYLYFGGSLSGDNEVWRTNGTPAGTAQFKAISRYTSSDPEDFVTLGKNVYFSAYSSTYGRELFKTNGTSAGTIVVANIATGSENSNPFGMVNAAGSLHFFATTSNGGTALYKSDGTAAGTLKVSVTGTFDEPGNTALEPSKPLLANGSYLYFAARKRFSYGREVMIYSPNPAAASSNSSSNAIAIDQALSALSFEQLENERRARRA